MWLFYLTIVFSVGYLVLYPGLGSYAGKLSWASTGEYKEELKAADAQYGPLFAQYMQQDLKTVAADPQAHAIGQRLFLTYCAQCHGSDARGSKGFPNLTDNDWLHGGTPEIIKTTIMEGRHGVMPPMGAAVGSDDDVKNVAHYVLSLSGSSHDPIKAVFGKSKFGACMACHGPGGTGNQALGAPNLTDKIWLYGGGVDTIMEPSARVATTPCRHSRTSSVSRRCMCWRRMSGVCRILTAASTARPVNMKEMTRRSPAAMPAAMTMYKSSRCMRPAKKSIRARSMAATRVCAGCLSG